MSSGTYSTIELPTENELEITNSMLGKEWINIQRTEEFEKDEKALSCSENAVKTIKRRLPITNWISTYGKKDLISDMIAGVTVGLTVVPQSMAYAAIAGLSPEYGLYSSYIGVLVYVLLGSCRQVTIGPTAVMGLLTFQTCGNDYPSCVILAGFYSGVFELLMALLRLGWVVSFISEPVTIGFTAAAAATIISSQIKSFFGMTGAKGDGFVGYWETIIADITTLKVGDTVMGITSFIILLLLRKLKDFKLKDGKFLNTCFWLISLSRNVVIVISTSIIAYVWSNPPFQLVGKVQGGFPSIKLPPFLLPKPPIQDIINATTIDPFMDDSDNYTFWESWSVLSTGPLVIALISILQNVAISKAFGSGQLVDATQEMFALGIVNILGGFMSCIPTSASFSRSAVNEASGVRSPLGGLYTGILVLLSLGFLTPSFYYIPKASLAAVIITAVMFMIEFEALIPMWKISRIDFLSSSITFVFCLYLGMEFGIVIGVGFSVAIILLKTLRPAIQYTIKSDERTGVHYLLINPENGMIFPSVDHISSSIQKFCLKNKSSRVIAISFAKWTTYDYTAANTLTTLAKGMEKNNQIPVFLDCNEEWVSVLELAGMKNPPCILAQNLPDFLRKKSVFSLKDLNVMINLPKPDEDISAGFSRNSSGGKSGVSPLLAQ